ncbi:hypothetical protein NPX13_g10966 [Xylaria arbuscula]|uniref:Uncharacterized protein n=1 Tax=Xylaria arbuscula TaxID=114810 RepID=A0A9W8N423_9PEZI|nr:hypothetical protein NPX13_g10966 [Xylaria arbuscula]
MKPFEEAVKAASTAEEIPGAVLVATDKSGKFNYGKAFGKRLGHVDRVLHKGRNGISSPTMLRARPLDAGWTDLRRAARVPRPAHHQAFQ